jgi:hypothetical protein
MLGMLWIAGLVVIFAPMTPWRAVDAVYDDAKRLVIYEWFSPEPVNLRVPIAGADLGQRMKVAANVLDRNARVTSRFVAFDARWLPARLRLYDNAIQWCKQQRGPGGKSLERAEKGWTIRLEEGETISLDDLESAGAPIAEVAPCFRGSRFIARGERVSSEDLLEGLAAGLGGRVAKTGTAYDINVDPRAFRRRRIALAQEHLKRVRVPPPSSVVTAAELDALKARIEILALNRLTDKQVSELYASLEATLLWPVAPESDLGALPIEKLRLTL